jgi:DNA-binding response OmpR family regulator
MRVLLIEDDDRVAAALTDVLGRQGYAICRAHGVERAVELLTDDVEVALLDLGLPDGDGFELCRTMRARRDVPIIITTARSDLRSRVHGLHVGADDYLIKPYAVTELIARINAVLRRAQRAAPAPENAVAVRSGVTIDTGRRVVTVEGQPVRLTRKEFDVLAVLARHPGLVIGRDQLLSEVWGSSWTGDQHTLDVHVAAIRSKCGRPQLITTVRGVGYRLSEMP